MTEKRYNILYVDDEIGNLRVFQASFKKRYEVFVASSGDEALQLLEAHDIHLVVTDQKMPKMTGVELLEQMGERWPDTMKLILTGYSDVEDIIHALNKCGIYRYLMKPWQKEEMQVTLDKALEIYQLRKDREELLEELKATNEQLEDRIRARTQELQDTNGQLRQEIEERKIIERDLKEAKEKAEEATRAKQLFLSTMSHEIRTPLNAVIGMAYLLQQSNLDAAQQENLKLLLFSAKNLLTLINDILDLSRIESGKFELEDATFNPHELLQNLSNAHRPKAVERELRYEVEVDTRIPRMLRGDQTRLGQVLNNLLGNAFKFTSEGCVSLRVALEGERDGKAVLRFSVSDTGIGIPLEKQELIFEHFSQASSETTRKYGGSGLGLAIARKIIDMQGGKLEVSSEVGRGATFSFALEFPVASQQGPVAQLLSEAGGIAAGEQDLIGQLRILLVEDNPINQILMRKFFSRWKAQHHLAQNGREAVEMVQQHPYDVVLMDIQMPEMDGYAATQAIRALSGSYFQKLPIIALTASTLQGEQLRAQQVGMNDYVVKPFDPQVLAEKILRCTRAGISVMQEPQFDDFRSLMEDDEEGYRELMQATKKDLEGLQEALRAFKFSHDTEKLMVASHNMKPPLQMMGLSHISLQLKQLREVQEEERPTLFAALERQLSTLNDCLAREAGL